MGKYLRYILSLRYWKERLNRRKLHKMKQSDELSYTAALFDYIRRYPKSYDVNLRRLVTATLRSSDIGELLDATVEFHSCVTSEAGGRYYTRLPYWYNDPPTPVALSDYSVVDGYFTDLEATVNKLGTLVKEIHIGVNKEDNAELSSYYSKKARKLYHELIALGEALM